MRTDTNSDTDLYRFFGSDDELLYIGISLHAAQRASRHAKEKTWWGEVDRMVIERFPDRASAMAAEADAIKIECPKYNVMHNGDAGSGAASPTGLDVGTVHAFGLTNGECPVGMIIDIRFDKRGTPTYLVVDMFSWTLGFFDAGECVIRWPDLVMTRAAHPDSTGEFPMEECGSFQGRWRDNHRAS